VSDVAETMTGIGLRLSERVRSTSSGAGSDQSPNLLLLLVESRRLTYVLTGVRAQFMGWSRNCCTASLGTEQGSL